MFKIIYIKNHIFNMILLKFNYAIFYSYTNTNVMVGLISDFISLQDGLSPLTKLTYKSEKKSFVLSKFKFFELVIIDVIFLLKNSIGIVHPKILRNITIII